MGMMRRCLPVLVVSLALICATAQNPPAKKPKGKTPATPTKSAPKSNSTESKPETPAPKTDSKPENNAAELESVLTQLDKASADFKSTEADFVWEQYQKVVDETDVQKGKIYFVRREKDTQMAANVLDPDKKDLVYIDGKLRFYQPRIDQVTEYEAGPNRGEVESFLVLGFGSRGHDLGKSFEIKFGGFETIDGTRTAKLELTPKAPKIRNTFDKIILWVDPLRGVSQKQQFIEPSGDFRLAKYLNFKMNGKVADDVFKIKMTSKTKVVRQQ